MHYTIADLLTRYLLLTISTANIQFNEQGTPVATDFDDVYFSNQNGLAETRYVFLENNNFPHRLLDCQSPSFVIAETGFGTGLNFLATWQAYNQLKEQHPSVSLPTLYYISTEKYPLTRDALQQALTHWPELQHLSDALIKQYPPSLGGCHRLVFAQGNIILDLWLGDVHESLPQMSVTTTGHVNAWYLDGFAPSKNPQMWTQTLFDNMARLSAQDCTFATFTAAGIVKRGLALAGFTVEKRKGFGHKRDMLAGKFEGLTQLRETETYFYRTSAHPVTDKTEVAILGTGLAGANIAAALARRGISSVTYGKHELADGASGNPQGGFYPQLNAQASIASRIQALSFLFARQRYDSLLSDGFSFAHDWCGVLQLGFNDTVLSRHQKIASSGIWPDSIMEYIEADKATQIAGIDLPYPALYIPLGGWINPPQLVNALFDFAARHADSTVKSNHTLSSLHREQDSWCLTWQDGSETQANVVIIATGADTASVRQCQDLPFSATRGQVEAVPTQSPLSSLKTVLCHKGYLTPEFDGQHALGSTYVKNDNTTTYRDEEEQQNLATHQQALAKLNWVEHLDTKKTGRASTRCSVPDHQPVCGAVPNFKAQLSQFESLYKALPSASYPIAEDEENLFVLSALGSRGLTTAPLMAELLVSQLTGAPLPLEQDLLNALAPNRFLIRDAIRRKL